MRWYLMTKQYYSELPPQRLNRVSSHSLLANCFTHGVRRQKSSCHCVYIRGMKHVLSEARMSIPVQSTNVNGLLNCNILFARYGEDSDFYEIFEKLLVSHCKQLISTVEMFSQTRLLCLRK